MKGTFIIMLVLLMAQFVVQAQSEINFRVDVSTDSVLLGNRIEVTFLLENGEGNDFQSPEFKDFDVISGPSTSSSFSSINGKVTRSISYTYFIEPREIGNFYIEPASINVEGSVLETTPVEIMVVPNPEGIIQTPKKKKSDVFDFWDFEEQIPQEKIPQQKQKSKPRKIYKL